MKRTVYFLLLAAAAAVVVTRWMGPTPPPDRLRASSPGAEFVNVTASMDYYRERITREPEVVRNYVELAQLHLQKARETGRESEHLPQVRKLLDEALERDPDNFHALALKGSLLNSLHQFEEGRTIALRLLKQNDHSAYAQGILVDALVELGRYREAVRACDRMLALRPEIASYARASYIRELHGDAAGAIAAMRLAADAGVTGREDRAWVLYNLGTLYLREGKADTAAFIFNGILDERPGYAHAVAGLGRISAAAGKHEEAIARYYEAYETQPRPEFLMWMMDSYAELGDAAEVLRLRGEVRKTFESARETGEIVDMEYADYLADQDLDRTGALRLAKKELRRRPDHVHVLETYAWTLFKNGRADAAMPYVERALRLGARDAMLHFRAARIYEAGGAKEKAAEHLRAALEDHLEVESARAAREAKALLAALSQESALAS